MPPFAELPYQPVVVAAIAGGGAGGSSFVTAGGRRRGGDLEGRCREEFVAGRLVGQQRTTSARSSTSPPQAFVSQASRSSPGGLQGRVKQLLHAAAIARDPWRKRVYLGNSRSLIRFPTPKVLAAQHSPRHYPPVQATPTTSFLKLAGPGLIVAATGIGSGDVVSATVGGASYGVVLLWAIVARRVLQVRAERGHRALAARHRHDRDRGLGRAPAARG